MQPQSPGTLADRNVKHVEVRSLAQELERVSSDAKRQIAVEGWDHVQAAAPGKPHRLLAGGLKVAPEFDQFGAERAHRGVLLARIALGDEDRHLKAGAPPGEGETCPMIAARRGNQPANRRLALDQRIDVCEAAANLEGAGRQMVLVLDNDLGAEPLVEQRPIERRRWLQGMKHHLMRPTQLL